MQNKKIYLCFVLMYTLLCSVPHASARVVLISDFDDGTLQGWTPEQPFGGTLFVDTTGGNPGGAMRAIDTVGGGGGLYARAPAPLFGDLSSFAGLQWDEFVPFRGASTTGRTSIDIRGVDGTRYRITHDGPLSVWTTQFAPFDDASAWTLIDGNATFEDVISNVEALFIQMDTSTQVSLTESLVDNIRLTGELHITNKPILAVKLGEFFSHEFEAALGEPPYSWSIVNGTLPDGVLFDSDGTLSGTPTESGEFIFTVRVEDSNGDIAEKEFTLKVLEAPPPPEIHIHKTGTVAVPGRVISYFIIVENVGETTATDVEIFEFLDPLENFSDPSSVNPSVSLFKGNILVWNIQSLNPGEFKLFNYNLTISPIVQRGELVNGQAVVVCDQCKADNACRNIDFVCNKFSPSLPSGIGLVNIFELWFNQNFPSKECTAFTIQCYENCFKELCQNDSHDQEARVPRDPNEKLVVADKFIQPNQLLVYPIHFENIGNVEAQDVFVTDVLDPNLDTSTLEILTPDGASFDSSTRTLKWELIGRDLQPGETGNVLLSIRPKPGLPPGTIIRNSAKIQFEIFEPLVTPEVVNIIAGESMNQADLGVAKSDAVDPVIVGDDVTYTVEVSNNGPSDTQNVVVTDTLPDGVTFVSAVPDQGSCNDSVGTVTCNLESMANGTSVNITIVITTMTDGTLTNTASVVSSIVDPNPDNDSVSETTTVNPKPELMADLAISKRDDSDPVTAGNSLTYTVTVANNGPDETENVVVTDTLPSGVSNATTNGCSEDPGGVSTCNLGNIASGDSVEYTITVDVDIDTSGTIINSAQVSSGTTDPNDANDSVTEDTMVNTPEPVGCPDDVLISNYQTSSPQFVEVANVGNDIINLDGCSLITFNVSTETSIGAATISLSGTLNVGETKQFAMVGMPVGPGAFGIYDIDPPPNGTPFSTDNEITGMVYLNNDTVFGISHLTKPEHNDIYECIYGGSGQGPFMRPFQPLTDCLPQ